MDLLLDQDRDDTALQPPMRSMVLVIEKLELKRDWLVRWLECGQTAYRVVAVDSVAGIDVVLTSDQKPRLVVVSIGGAEVRSPEVQGLLGRVGARLEGVPVVLLADRDEVDEIAEALRLGVRGYIPTSIDKAVADGALHLVQVGGTFVPPSAFLRAYTQAHRAETDTEPSRRDGVAAPSDLVDLATSRHAASLTRRQQQVLSLLQHGKSNKIIAFELSMQESTVKAHIRNLMRKLRASNRTQAALRGYELIQSAAD